MWELRAAYDRTRIMRDLTALTPKPPRSGSAPACHRPLSGCFDLARLVRSLVIDGYDRPLRRWALERCRRGMNAMYFAAGLLAAAVIAGIGSLVTDPLAGSDAMAVVARINLVAAGVAVLYALSRILPVVTASAYAGAWVRNMPRSRAAPRYRRLYEESHRSG